MNTLTSVECQNHICALAINLQVTLVKFQVLTRDIRVSVNLS